MSERFYVDRRVGCIAVRDRTKIDPEYPGLHPDTEGVVRFWSLPKLPVKCETCGHVGEQFSDGEPERLIAECLAEELNADHVDAVPN